MPDHAATNDRRIAPALMVLLLAWLAFRESGALEVGDVFWHLRTGDLILDDGLPTVDPFSWTAGGQPWQPNAWLSDVIWAGIRSTVGSAGISIIAGVTIIAVALLLYRAAVRLGAGPYAAAATGGISVIFMSPFIAPRPLVVGLLLAPVVIEAAHRYLAGSARSLAVVAVVVMAWSNLHGSFVTGVGILGLIAIGAAIDSRSWRRPLVLAAVTVSAGLVNPYGLSAYLHTLDIRDESVNIDEWQPLAVDDPRGIVLLAFMAVTAWAAWRVIRHRGTSDGLRSQPSTHLLPAAVLAVLTLGVVRTGAFFLIAAAPIVASEVGKIRAESLRRWARPRRGPLTVGLLAAALILAVQQAPDLASAGEPGPRFSSELVAAIPQTCVLLNEYDLGGFIIDRRWPEISVSQDGRNDLYGAAEIERQSGLLESSDARGVERAGVTCVLADLDRPVVPALADDPDWSEAGRSAELILFVKDRPSA